MVASFKPGEFLIAQSDRTLRVKGLTNGDLGLDKRGSMWILTHCNTGHRIAAIYGNKLKAVEFAEEIAGCGDWSFIGLEGWKNSSPELRNRVKAICYRFDTALERGNGFAESARVVFESRSC